MIANIIEIKGTLEPDGRLVLDEKPALPPGRVAVALRALEKRPERLPDAPRLDDSVPAPFDLPRSGAMPVQVRRVADRLPERTDELTEQDG